MNVRRIIVFGLVAVLLAVNGFLFYQNRTIKERAQRMEVNLKASNDSLRVEKDKQGRIEYDKLAFITGSLKELQDQNKELANEVKAVKGTVKTIQVIDAVIKHDTVEIPSEVVVTPEDVTITANRDTTYSPGNYRKLSVQTVYSFKDSSARAKLLTDEIGFTATLGFKKTSKGLEGFVTPHYPNMAITHLESAVIDKNYFKPKKKKITVGGTIGLTPVLYDWKSKQLDFNWHQVGATIGINYNF